MQDIFVTNVGMALNTFCRNAIEMAKCKTDITEILHTISGTNLDSSSIFQIRGSSFGLRHIQVISFTMDHAFPLNNQNGT